MPDPRDLRWLQPDLVALPHGDLLPGLAVGIDTASGRIARVEPPPDDARDLTPLPGCALLPGFVNAHSHAFQRLLRGRTEHLTPGREDDDFWSWRDLMYQLANTLDPDDLYHNARDLFDECLRAGYTTLGEFHYLHHDPNGLPYPNPHQTALAITQAARDVGLRLTLLPVLYAAAGFDTPPSHAQRRFIHPDTHTFLNNLDRLLTLAQGDDLLRIGVAPHSVRAVPLPELTRLAAWAAERKLPLHIHACEQPAEVQQTRLRYGHGPLQLLQRAGLLTPHLTVVHATWLDPDDPQRLADAQAHVCACPSTEANLGDGFLPAYDLLRAGVPLCIGSDSHILVNPFEELRLIENNERLQRRRRNVLASLQPPSTDQRPLRIAPHLLHIGAQAGARALGWDHGTLAPGQLADLIAIDLNAPALRRVPTHHLPEALIFSADTACVAHTWVHGVRRTSAR